MIAGIDTGGTFTDCLSFVAGRPVVYKLLSTPEDPAQAVLHGLKALEAQSGQAVTALMHGTTVATNALLEHKGARVTLLMTAGFRDLVQIGRQNRASLYDLQVQRPPLLYQKVLEVQERMGAHGEELQALDEAEIQRLIAALPPETEAVAVCLLFAYAWPEHEARLAAALRQAGWTVSASHEVLPVYREYERFATTLANAALQPVMQRYMQRLEAGLQGLPCQLMQSNGGSLSLAEVAQQPVRCALSGPAGGLIGALELGRQLVLAGELEQLRLLSFDMGGTSTDVALLDGQLPLQTEATINGLPLALPMLAIHTVGAGGGSRVSVDAGGALRVGPESAGAAPGPLCYGHHGHLAVTDAHVFLGRIPANSRLGGSLALDTSPLPAAFAALGQRLGLSPEAAASGVIAVANANMERALRVVSVEKGHDPRDFALFCFGGAGGLHACDLARSLGLRRIIFPAYAGVFSALGMLFAPRVRDLSQTVLGQLALKDIRGIRAAFERLQGQLGVDSEARFVHSMDLRYAGQSFEINVPWGLESEEAFHELHERWHGYCRRGHPVELVTLRLRQEWPGAHPPLPAWPVHQVATEAPRQQRVWVDNGWREVPVWQRSELVPGSLLSGPALILEETATLYLAPDFTARLEAHGHLLLEFQSGGTPR